MDGFFSGKHLNEKNFEQMTNQQIDLHHHLEQKQGRDNVWYNEVLNCMKLFELDNVINKRHNTACSIDEITSTLR